MIYHLCKQSRLYSGFPYHGPTSENIPAETNDLWTAIFMAKHFQERNPVGWNVFDSRTGECVYGEDFFKD